MKDSVFHFTVAQLIDMLKTLPQDLPVLTSGYESGFENFYSPEIVSLQHVPDNMYFEGAFQAAEDGAPNSFQAVILQREMRYD